MLWIFSRTAMPGARSAKKSLRESGTISNSSGMQMRRLGPFLFAPFLVLGLFSSGYKLFQSEKSIAQAQSDIKLGEQIYRENCAACHGEKGDVKGPQADR